MRLRKHPPSTALATGAEDYQRWLEVIDVGIPGWTLHVDGIGDGPVLSLYHPVERDRARGLALQPGDTAAFSGTLGIKAGLSFDEFADCVHFLVLEASEHEVNEHFRVYGDLRFNPHRPGATSRIRRPTGLRVET